MTPQELQVKFDALAEPIMAEGRRDELKQTVFELEKVDDVGKLMDLTVADR